MYMEQNKKRNPNTNSNPCVSALIGGGMAIAVTVLTALVFPLISLRFNDPNALTAVSAYLCLFFGAFFGAFVGSKRDGMRYLAVAMMSGGMMLLPMILISLIIPGGGSFVSAVAVVVVIAVAAFLGGMVAQRIDTGRKRNLKRVMRRR